MTKLDQLQAEMDQLWEKAPEFPDAEMAKLLLRKNNATAMQIAYQYVKDDLPKHTILAYLKKNLLNVWPTIMLEDGKVGDVFSSEDDWL